MSYAETVLFITNILMSLIGVLTLHFLIFAVVGLFGKKTFKKTNDKLKYGIIVPARNEETVIGGIIESIKKNNYPQENLKIFVVSHNSTDNTAKTARAAGAIVYEYNNPAENTMGYAFRHLFSCIERDYGFESFDGFFIFNADNILDKDYISYMNDAFCHYGKKSVITSFRNSKNFGSNLISGLYGMYFTVGCRLESRGRTLLGCSTRVQGTGYLIPTHVLKNGWQYVTLAEDWEFSADRILLDNTIKYCDDAVFYDEQPTTLKIMWRQRLRWSRGHLIVFITRIKDLIKSLFTKGKHKFSKYDISVNCMPIPLMIIFVYLLQIILLLIAPLFDKDASLRQIFLLKGGPLFVWLKSFIATIITFMISAVIIFAVERRRIKNVSLINKALITLLWPFFVLVQVFIDAQALFSKNLMWKPIPHSDTTSFEQINHKKK
ncbi:MAG: glycosyltransferase family 2 protein [Clostridia bacterium]|nr:glycosyltransferase family 2 protein [Clostridia bacterium]